MTTIHSTMRRVAALLVLALPGSAFAADDHALSDQLAAEAAAFAPPFVVTAAPPADPTGAGSWGAVIPWTPHIPVTVASLPDGRLLTFASNQRTTFPVGAEFTYAAVWNPATGVFTEINNTRHDMFCGGVAMLPDGRVVVNGGRNTTVLSSIFDYRTNQWSAIPNMNDPRWYNTSVALSDGTVFTVSGSGGSNTAERWDATSGWRRLTGIGWSAVTSQPGYINIWHPFLSIAPNGNLFHFGPTDVMNWVNPDGNGSLTPSGQNVPGAHYPKEGASAMYEAGKILVAGGGANTTPNPNDSTTGTSTNVAYTVDLNGPTPVVATCCVDAIHAAVCELGDPAERRSDGHRWKHQRPEIQRYRLDPHARGLEPAHRHLAHARKHVGAAQLPLRRAAAAGWSRVVGGRRTRRKFGGSSRCADLHTAGAVQFQRDAGHAACHYPGTRSDRHWRAVYRPGDGGPRKVRVHQDVLANALGEHRPALPRTRFHRTVRRHVPDSPRTAIAMCSRRATGCSSR